MPRLANLQGQRELNKLTGVKPVFCVPEAAAQEACKQSGKGFAITLFHKPFSDLLNFFLCFAQLEGVGRALSSCRVARDCSRLICSRKEHRRRKFSGCVIAVSVSSFYKKLRFQTLPCFPQAAPCWFIPCLHLSVGKRRTRESLTFPSPVLNPFSGTSGCIS